MTASCWTIYITSNRRTRTVTSILPFGNKVLCSLHRDKPHHWLCSFRCHPPLGLAGPNIPLSTHCVQSRLQLSRRRQERPSAFPWFRPSRCSTSRSHIPRIARSTLPSAFWVHQPPQCTVVCPYFEMSSVNIVVEGPRSCYAAVAISV